MDLSRPYPAPAKCANCGNALKPGDLFCGECSRPVPAQQPPTPGIAPKCAYCGSALNPGSLFCGECGRPVQTQQPPAPGIAPRPKLGMLVGALVGVVLLLGVGGVMIFFLAQRSPRIPAVTQPSPTSAARAAGKTPTSAQAGGKTPTSQPTQAQPVGSSNIYVEYILDSSGSMLETLQGKTKLEIAQDVLSEKLASLPPNINVGLRVYGHRVPSEQREQSCMDVELVVPIAAGGGARIAAWLPDMQAKGLTPIGESLRQASEDFTFDSEHKNSIILLSDGIETCGGDPATLVGDLQELGINFTVHVIGLGVDEEAREQLERIADVSGGTYYDAGSEQDLADALSDVNREVVESGSPHVELTWEPRVWELPTTELLVPTPVEPAAQGVDVASEGIAVAYTTDPNFPADLAIDGDRTTSWFSTGPEPDDAPSFFTWTGIQDEEIVSVSVLSNRDNKEPSFRTNWGFGSVTVQVLDAAGEVVFVGTHSLEGTPDPDVTVYPNVVGRSVALILSDHEDKRCGGFSELQVKVRR